MLFDRNQCMLTKIPLKLSPMKDMSLSMGLDR